LDVKTKSLIAAAITFGAAVAAQAADPTPVSSTLLGVRGGEFTLNGKSTFLLGFSYYGALGAHQATVRRDLEDAQRLGFNWLRVWATWNAFDHDISVVGADGAPREPFLGKLKWLVTECDRRGLVVDVTLTRGKTLRDLAAHQQAVETIVKALTAQRNWFLDLANEHDVHDARFVSDAELKRLRDLVRRLAPPRLVTASFGGRDLTTNDVRASLPTIGLDFLAPHRPRTAQSPHETEVRTRALRSAMRELGCVAPILYQEPFRRGYTRWEPLTEDFLNDLRGAIAGGAAGWCFHNGQQGNAADNQPRRSFDLRERRLFDQLDDVERQVVRHAAIELKGARTER
jgi:hypothetical protein